MKKFIKALSLLLAVFLLAGMTTVGLKAAEPRVASYGDYYSSSATYTDTANSIKFDYYATGYWEDFEYASGGRMCYSNYSGYLNNYSKGGTTVNDYTTWIKVNTSITYSGTYKTLTRSVYSPY